jgi:hypothetical protein
MAGITERNKQKTELAAMGYSLRYIDEWQPKTILYRHKAAYNTEGTMMEGVGTFIGNVPGTPDYVVRKSRIGLFTWPPSDTCICKWCLERRQPGEPVQQASQDTPGAAEGQRVGEGASATPVSRRRETGQTGPYYQAS